MSQPVVEVKDVSRHYVLKGETIRALDGVSLSVERGEFMAVAGPSGSGKSTLLNLIGALDSPTSGSIAVDGRDLARLSRTELSQMRCRSIGFIFQSYNLIPVLTVMENVEYVMLLQGVGKEERRERSRAILAEVGLAGMEDRRPAELSGGQQQRAAVARAIVSRPALVLADEPTANLDSVTGAELLDTMAELNKHHGATFIFSTHDTKVMERASRLIMLRDGKVASNGRPGTV